MLSRKRGQVSIEVLAILGVVVIGSILFGAYYVTSIQKGIAQGDKAAGALDNFEDQLGDNGEPCVGAGCGSTTTTTTTECEDQIAATGLDCDGDCPPCDYNPGDFDLNLSLNPSSSTQINLPFGIDASVNNYVATTGVDVIIKKIVVTKDNVQTGVCNYNGTIINGTWDNISSLRMNESGNNYNLSLNGFSCSEPGTYRFTISAGEENDTNDSKNDSAITDPSKVITSVVIPPTGDYSVSITEPVSDKLYFIDQLLVFTATIATELKPGDTDKCVWYIDNSIEIPTKSYLDSCSFTLTDIASLGIEPGVHKISVFAERTTTIGNFKAENTIEFTLLKPIPIGEMALLAPSNTFVGEIFPVTVYGDTEGQVNASRSVTTFNFTNTACSVQSATPSCGSELIGTRTIYYCNYQAVCNKPSYEQTGVHNLLPVTITLPSASSTQFNVGYDLLFKSGNCVVTATEDYGTLQSCVNSTSGLSYNDNYWNNSSYGLLKIYINTPSETTVNNYGTLTAYVSE